MSRYMQKSSRAEMEAAMAVPEMKCQELSVGKEETKIPTETALPESKEEARGPENTAGAKFKAPECTGTSEMKATEDTQSKRTARAAEKVANTHISMVMKTAKAELKHRRAANLKQMNPDPCTLEKKGRDAT
ncbi:uncharacterized protein LOC143831096 [Paroedura picta]|uniref:uncharacterized protein LOC143831096 n=1 Tax=Paroedura picta TaxID=143630 RepID=UPI004056709C